MKPAKYNSSRRTRRPDRRSSASVITVAKPPFDA